MKGELDGIGYEGEPIVDMDNDYWDKHEMVTIRNHYNFHFKIMFYPGDWKWYYMLRPYDLFLVQIFFIQIIFESWKETKIIPKENASN